MTALVVQCCKELLAPLFQGREKIKSIELESKVNRVRGELVLLIPSVITLLRACIELANYGIDNYVAPEELERPAPQATEPMPRPQTATSDGNSPWYRKVVRKVVRKVGRTLSSWFSRSATTGITTPPSASTSSTEDAAPNERKNKREEFEDNFNKMYSRCMEHYETSSDGVQGFRDQKLIPLVNECLSTLHQATGLEKLRSLQRKCFDAVGLAAGVIAVISVGIVCAPATIPTAIATMVPVLAGMVTAVSAHAGSTVFVAFFVFVCCRLTARYSWFREKDVQKATESLNLLITKVEMMERFLRQTTFSCECCKENAKQARDVLELSKLNEKDELVKLMRGILDDANLVKPTLEETVESEKRAPHQLI